MDDGTYTLLDLWDMLDILDLQDWIDEQAHAIAKRKAAG